jgi:hypothetical protein
MANKKRNKKEKCFIFVPKILTLITSIMNYYLINYLDFFPRLLDEASLNGQLLVVDFKFSRVFLNDTCIVYTLRIIRNPNSRA